MELFMACFTADLPRFNEKKVFLQNRKWDLYTFFSVEDSYF